MAEQLRNALGIVEQGQQAVFGMVGNLLGGGQPDPAPAQEPAPVPAPPPEEPQPDDGIEAEWDGEEEDELDDADAHPELHGNRDEGYTGEGN